MIWSLPSGSRSFSRAYFTEPGGISGIRKLLDAHPARLSDSEQRFLGLSLDVKWNFLGGRLRQIGDGRYRLGLSANCHEAIHERVVLKSKAGDLRILGFAGAATETEHVPTRYARRMEVVKPHT